MGSERQTFTSGEFFVALHGFAAMRRLVVDPGSARPHLDAIGELVAGADDAVNTFAIPVEELDVAGAYARWADTYDGPNPAIRMEEPIVHGIVADLPVGQALDAACGTGRHAAHLHELGWDVTGIDATPAMLDQARAKAPEVRFEVGDVLALPLAEGAVDLVTCSLALTHVPDLEAAIAEMARVVRPGGTVVLSDIHPMASHIGGTAAFPHDGGLAHVRNIAHPVSHYLRAARQAGLDVVDCVEVEPDEAMFASHLAHAFHPEAVRAAFEGLPFVLVWHLRRPEA